jgi:hypothetical protein
MVKLNRIGNFFRFNLKGRERERSYDSNIGILGMKTHFPACCPLTILTSIEFFINPLTISCIPLQSPFCGFGFCNRMTWQFLLIVNSWGGNPFGDIELRISYGYIYNICLPIPIMEFPQCLIHHTYHHRVQLTCMQNYHYDGATHLDCHHH